MLARQIAIGFGIAIIFPLLVYYGVSTLHSPPKYSDYFTGIGVVGSNATTEEKATQSQKGRVARAAYEAAQVEFTRILIIVATPLGIAAILIGAFMHLHSIGTGLILGGIATVATGYFNYWDQLTDGLHFVSLLLSLAILVFVGYRQFSVTRSSRIQ
jgi:ABC-type proline/glycine betaine transport system permease subunit